MIRCLTAKGNLVFGSRPNSLVSSMSGPFWGVAYMISDLIIFANPNAETVNGAYSFLLVDPIIPNFIV